MFAYFAMTFYPSAINTFDVSVNAVFGNIGELLFLVSKPASNRSWRLVVIEMPVNKLFEELVANNFHSLVLGVFSFDVGFVLGFPWVVLSFYAVM